MFIGCAGWPDCDVTYPLPKGKIEARDRAVPYLRHASGEGDGLPLQAACLCIDPNCDTNKEPDVDSGRVPHLQGKGPGRRSSIAHKNPRTLEAFHPLRELRRVRDGLPASAVRRAHGHGRGVRALRRADGHRDHARGPWKLCPNFDCPGKEQDEEKKGATGAKGAAKKARGQEGGRRRSPRRRRLPPRSRPPRRLPPTKPSGRFPIGRLVGPDRPRQRSLAAALSCTCASTGRPGKASGSCRTLLTGFLRCEGGFSDL